MSTLAARAVTMAIVLVVGLGGCARRPVAQQAPAAQTQQLSSGGAQQGGAYQAGAYQGGAYQGGHGGYVTAPAAGAQLLLGQDLYCQFGNVRLQLLANGQFWVDGSFVGTFTPDGGFYNVDGVEIGRLHAGGQMTYAGTMQDASIAGSQVVGPSGVIAYIDGAGSLAVVGGQVPPAPIAGLSAAHVRSFLFAFSMFAALLDTAERMGY